MILSNLIKNNKKLTLSKYTKLLNFLLIKKQLKKKPNSQTNCLKIKNKKFYKSLLGHNVVSYVINVISSNTNSIISVTDVKGNVLTSISAGNINLTKFQKKVQPTALLNIFKILLGKAKYLQNKSVAVHFKNVKRFHESFFLKLLKKNLFIKSFQSYNLLPHNGCRPKKIKRIKRRTKRLLLR